MSNRIAGNIIILDSAAGNNFALNALPNHYSKYVVNAIAVYRSDTSAAVILTGTNTANDLIFKYDGATPTSTLPNPAWFSFGQAQRIEDFKLPLLTAATAFIYLV